MGGVDSQARATLLLVESKKCGAGRNKTYDSPSSEQYTVFGLTPTTVVANKPPPLPFPTNNRRIKKVRPRSAPLAVARGLLVILARLPAPSNTLRALREKAIRAGCQAYSYCTLERLGRCAASIIRAAISS